MAKKTKRRQSSKERGQRLRGLSEEQVALLENAKKRAKKLSNEQRVYCNRCRRITPHRLLRTTSKERMEEYGDELYEPESGGVPSCTIFDMLECCGCREVVLRRIFHCPDPEVHARMANAVENVDDNGVVEDDIRYFPPAMSRDLPRWRFRLPTAMRELLDEIYKSLDAGNLRLPMMGARAIVDMLIVDKIGDVGNFKEKLNDFEKEGFLSPKNREALHAALEVGDAASHRGHAATETEVQQVMDIVETMLQAVYVFPEQARNLKKTTPQRPPRPPKIPSARIN